MSKGQNNEYTGLMSTLSL